MKSEEAPSKVSSLNIHQDLIDACRKNDQKAQFKIYKLYYKAMYICSLRIVNDPMEAEDIMQESFLSAFEEINKFSGNVTFGAWLKSIVYNRSIDSLRKSKRVAFEKIESASGMEDEYAEIKCQNEEPEMTDKRIPEIIRLLPEKAGKIFTLFFLEGYDYEEICDIMSISSGTSRSQLSRARSRFISEYKSKY